LDVPFSRFADQADLSGFLIDARDVECPRDLAAKAVATIAPNVPDESCKVLCASVCNFLDELSGRPVEDPEQERRLRDLGGLIKQRAQERAYKGLFDSWHG
jgi:hypothetical protein